MNAHFIIRLVHADVKLLLTNFSKQTTIKGLYHVALCGSVYALLRLAIAHYYIRRSFRYVDDISKMYKEFSTLLQYYGK